MPFTRTSALVLSGAVAGIVAVSSLAGALVVGGDDADATTPTTALLDEAVPVDTTTPTTAPAVEVVYQDVYDLPPATGPAASTSSPAGVAPVAAADLSSAPAATDDWDDDDADQGEYKDEWEDEYEYEDDEYEGEDEDEDDDDLEDDDDEGEWEDD